MNGVRSSFSCERITDFTMCCNALRVSPCHPMIRLGFGDWSSIRSKPSSSFFIWMSLASRFKNLRSCPMMSFNVESSIVRWIVAESMFAEKTVKTRETRKTKGNVFSLVSIVPLVFLVPKKAPALRRLFLKINSKNYRTASLSVLPALKDGTFIAGMEIFCVGFLGFTPMRAARWFNLNVPKPVMVTGVPFFRFLMTRLIIAWRASAAARFVMPEASAIAAMRSCLDIEKWGKEIGSPKVFYQKKADASHKMKLRLDPFATASGNWLLLQQKREHQRCSVLRSRKPKISDSDIVYSDCQSPIGIGNCAAATRESLLLTIENEIPPLHLLGFLTRLAHRHFNFFTS